MARGEFTVSLTLNVPPRSTLALAGPNGAGKSSALAAIAGLVPLTSGWVSVGSRIVADVDRQIDVPSDQRRVGVVFQDVLLFPHLTVRDNVAFPFRVGAARMGRADARRNAEPWIDRFDLAGLAHLHPAQLSRGQAQRVALARALAAEPDVLLLDEPLTALDIEVRDDVRGELAKHLRSFEGPTIIVTHDVSDIATLADEVIVLEQGRVTQRGSLAALRSAPASAYIERMVGSTL